MPDWSEWEFDEHLDSEYIFKESELGKKNILTCSNENRTMFSKYSLSYSEVLSKTYKKNRFGVTAEI